MVEKIEFDKPKFNESLNITVRKGDKWHNRMSVFDTFMAEQEPATVHGKMLATIDMLDEGILQYEHNPKARNKQGLKEILRTHYDNIDNSTLISIIFFKVGR